MVRDATGIRADLDRAGDEPLMLARQLEGVSVLVCADRHLAGRLAEHHLDCTVHVLDDGFQHFPLHRDADIVVVGEGDLPPEADLPPKGGSHLKTLPTGRLREPVDAIDAADALIILESGERRAESGKRPADSGQRKAESGKRTADGGERQADSGQRMWPARRRQPAAPDADPVVAVAGIAEPSRFFRELRRSGWHVARELPYRDHHRYAPRDVAGMIAAARAAGAGRIVTTEKDFVRLLPYRPFAVPIAAVPLTLELDDAAGFDDWLRERVAAARSRA